MKTFWNILAKIYTFLETAIDIYSEKKSNSLKNTCEEVHHDQLTRHLQLHWKIVSSRILITARAGNFTEHLFFKNTLFTERLSVIVSVFNQAPM